MGAVINLSDFGTRAVLSRFNLVPQLRIGKGALCAVYADGPDAVLKLTTDAIQLESVRDYFGGVHFPALLENIGYVGEQAKGERSLFLFKAERLKPISAADPATRKLAKAILQATNDGFRSNDASRAYNQKGTRPQKRSRQCAVVLGRLCDNLDFPESIRDALAKVQLMSRDYVDLCIDFHRANLMVRGTDELVLNDVIVDGALLYD